VEAISRSNEYSSTELGGININNVEEYQIESKDIDGSSRGDIW
jgi:hypothetical protein